MLMGRMRTVFSGTKHIALCTSPLAYYVDVPLKRASHQPVLPCLWRACSELRASQRRGNYVAQARAPANTSARIARQRVCY